MDKNIIKNYLNSKFLSEAATPGISVTSNIHKEDGKINKAANKATEKELASYDKNVRKEDKNASKMAKNKFNYANKEDEDYHGEMETLNGLEMNEYDGEPDKQFEDRAKKSIEGDSTMGNAQGGNTEPTWGASDEKFGKKLIKRVESSKKKRNKAFVPTFELGDKIMALPKKGVNESFLADPNYTHFAMDKVNNKLLEAWNYKDLDNEDIKYYSKMDLKDLDLDIPMNQIKIVTRRTLDRMGIDPEDINSWYNKSGIAESSLNEGLNPKSINKINDLIQTKGSRGTAVYLVDYMLYKVIGLDASDLADTVTYANGLDEIEGALNEKRYDAALTIAKETATFMLEDEGMGLDLFEQKKYQNIKENNKNKKTLKNTMKRLKFKKEFNGVGNALKLIPESYRTDNKVFEMTDGNETYKIRWEGNINEGKAIILTAANKTMVNEDIQRMKDLFNYKSEDTMGIVKGSKRIDEDKIFSEIWDKSKKLLTESEEDETEEETEEITEGENIESVKPAKVAQWDKTGIKQAPEIGNISGKKSKLPTGNIEGQKPDSTQEWEKTKPGLAPEVGAIAGKKLQTKDGTAPKAGVVKNSDKSVGFASKEVGSIAGKKLQTKDGNVPAPKKDEWEKAKSGQAAEAKKHVKMNEEFEDETDVIDNDVDNDTDNDISVDSYYKVDDDFSTPDVDDAEPDAASINDDPQLSTPDSSSAYDDDDEEDDSLSDTPAQVEPVKYKIYRSSATGTYAILNPITKEVTHIPQEFNDLVKTDPAAAVAKVKMIKSPR